MAKSFTTQCPNCGSRLACGEKDSSVTCFACDSVFDVASLQGSSMVLGGNNAGVNSISPLAMITGFDNPESGVVFIENFFDTYVWDEYYESDELFIPELNEVVKNNKIKNGAVGQSWYLDFKSLALPVTKKLEGLILKQNEIIEKYNPEDDTEAYSAFDTYRRITKLLIENREAIIKHLESAITYAQRFELDTSKMEEMKNVLSSLKASLEALVPVEQITDLYAFNVARASLNQAKAAEYAAKGIDAVTTYNQAVELFRQGDKHTALLKFESIREYSNSAEYVKKINQYFDFNEMFYFFGRYYIYKLEEIKSNPLDIKKGGLISKIIAFFKGNRQKDNGADLESSGLAFALYEVVNGIPAEEPVITGIDQFIGCYNNRYYYFKKGKGIFCYDFNVRKEYCLDSGSMSDYKTDGEYEFRRVLNDTAVIVKKKLKYNQKRGCLNKNKKKGVEEVRLNNFALLLIDFTTNSVKTAISEMVDIADHYGDKVFYSFAERIAKTKKSTGGCASILSIFSKNKGSASNEPEFKTSLRVCDLNTLANSNVLNEDCEIHAVKGEKIIYSLWTPNDLNRDLYIYDMRTQTEFLLETNVYGFFDIINDKVYYTVGNSSYCALVRNNFEGTDRLEVMNQVSNVVGIKAGWLYVKKGYGRNAALIKISGDGKQRIVVCTQYKKAYEITSSHIHYLDTDDCLRVVRSDGKENRKIANNIAWIVVDDKCIYYTREESVAEKKYALSLYRMDKEGRNIKKIAFGVDDAVNYDENTLYYSRELNVRFHVTVPAEKKKAEPEVFYQNFHVTRYYALNKLSEQSTVVLTLGMPHGTKTFKRGCIVKKEVEEEIIYKEEPIKCAYKRKGLKAPGAVEEDQYNEVEDQQNAPTVAKTATNMVSKYKDGCLSIFNKKGNGVKKKGSKKVSRASSASAGNNKEMISAIVFLVISAFMLISTISTFITIIVKGCNDVGIEMRGASIVFTLPTIIISAVLMFLAIMNYNKNTSMRAIWSKVKLVNLISIILSLLMIVVSFGSSCKGCSSASSEPEGSQPQAVALYEGGNSIDFESSETQYFYFIPTMSGTYSITSDSDTDPYVYVYDSMRNNIGYSDDGLINENFHLEIELMAGSKCYIDVTTRRSGKVVIYIEQV